MAGDNHHPSLTAGIAVRFDAFAPALLLFGSQAGQRPCGHGAGTSAAAAVVAFGKGSLPADVPAGRKGCCLSPPRSLKTCRCSLKNRKHYHLDRYLGGLKGKNN